jgi:hypothetical protein
VSNLPNRALPNCADESLRSLELGPSRPLIAICLIWWAAASAGLGWGAALPAAWRLVLVASVTGLLFPVVWSACKQLWVLSWQPAGELTLLAGPDRQGIPATLAPGSLRFGRWLLLRLRTDRHRILVVLDGAAVDPATFRRFLREVCRGTAESV